MTGFLYIHINIWQCPIKCVLKALAKTSALTEVKKLAGEGGTSIIISKKSPRLALKEPKIAGGGQAESRAASCLHFVEFCTEDGLTPYFPIIT